LPVDAEKEPKDHIANHRVSEFIFEVRCQYDKGNLVKGKTKQAVRKCSHIMRTHDRSLLENRYLLILIT